MLWWVYHHVKKVKGINEVYCAIDDERIERICTQYNMNYVMTANSHPEHISRIQEVSQIIDADYYICINGDEPLITEETIIPVIPGEIIERPYFGGAVRKLIDPAETIDFSNIKVVLTENGRCLYMSRTAVPYPKGSLFFSYNKYIGIECFNKQALDFLFLRPREVLKRLKI